MLMIQMSGGLGNQMFYYALYKALQETGKEVTIDDFTHYEDIGRKDNQLQEIFPLVYKQGTREDYMKLTDSSFFPLQRIRRKLMGRKDHTYREKNAHIFEESVFELDHRYLEGYWQSQKYFNNVIGTLRQDFLFDWTSFPKKAIQYRDEMQKTKSVSMHVRRGDYLYPQFSGLYGGICTEAYYETAMRWFIQKLGNCTFYLFTDDKEWGKKQERTNVVLVDCTDATNAYIDMALMSCCKHHIIANSSFSWWGAWLNHNSDKYVCAPNKWLNQSDGQDIFYGLCNVRIDEKGIVR